MRRVEANDLKALASWVGKRLGENLGLNKTFYILKLSRKL